MQTLTTQYNVQNGVKLPFIPAKILKGPNNGNPTLKPDFKSLVDDGSLPAPAFTPELLNLIKYVGVNESYGILTGKINTLAVNVYNSAKKTDEEGKETGELDLDLWQQLIAGATIAGETIADLEEKLDELSEQFEAIANGEANTPEEFAELKIKLKAISSEKAKIKETLAQRQEQAKLVAEKRAKTREANEAKAAAQAKAAGAGAVTAGV